MEFSIPQLVDAVARARGDAEALVHGERRLTWSALRGRINRVANLLAASGLGTDDRPHAPWESTQDHLALFLVNGPEYLEAMLGAYRARVAPFNVNYRYVAEELEYLLRDAHARAVVYHARFAPVLAEVLPQLEHVSLLLHVDDASGNDPVPRAIRYEDALSRSPAHDPAVEPTPDDLYILYTGGTTGMPKGVLWRQADVVVAALGIRRRDGSEYASLEEVVERARDARFLALPAPPFMHGAAQWNGLASWIGGGTLVLQDRTERFDAHDVLTVCEREGVSSLLIVGDAFAQPLIDALRERSYDLGALRFVISSGAALSPRRARELTTLLPGASILDVLGSSETGRQGQTSDAMADRGSGTFDRTASTVVLSADLTRVLTPGEDELGWMAQTGRVPLGYLNDPDKTARTFPVVDGVRYAVPGDRARLRADGIVELHGRESVCINTGGEKVFAEEVERALKHHPAVYDTIVVGRPHPRWGQEVVAVVQVREHADVTDDDLRRECGRHVAGYKVPKQLVRVARVERSPSGKPDYKWATAAALEAAPTWLRQ